MPISARMKKKQWKIMPPDDRADTIATHLNISQLTAQLLINRGICSTEDAVVFLNPKLKDLIPPDQMPGVTKAIPRIKKAIQTAQKITIFGDYDTDGISGVSIIWQILKLLGADVDYYIPHRSEEGYGLNADAICSLSEGGTKLLITVDCGATAGETAQLASKLGIDLIITDHHRLESTLPKAFAIVHPGLEPSYGNQESSGSMVAFKLAWAIANEFNNGPRLEPRLRDFMINATSLAAVGTIADIMDLRGENRILTSFGLKTLADCELVGVKALIETAGLTGQGLDSFHIGFRLGPMLNAAGRMGHARLAVELLTSDSEIRAVQIAEYLKEQNTLRRQCEQKIFKHACAMINESGLNHPDRKTIVIAEDSWHKGVIGIVASRIVDRYYKPTIILNTEAETAQGSARSIAGFDILDAICSCSSHLNDFGGHKMAAGVRLQRDKIESFAFAFEEYAKVNLNEDDFIDKLSIDAQTQLSNIRMDTVIELKRLEPFGQGNPRPIFVTKGVRLAAAPRRVGAKGSHLQLSVTDNTAAIRCIGFGMGPLEKKFLENEFFNVVYEADINTFNGSSNVQLVLADVQFD